MREQLNIKLGDPVELVILGITRDKLFNKDIELVLNR